MADLTFLQQANWENLPIPLPETIWVRLGTGTFNTVNRLALAQWLAQGGVIVDAP
jgi:hypothetical protein